MSRDVNVRLRGISRLQLPRRAAPGQARRVAALALFVSIVAPLFLQPGANSLASSQSSKPTQTSQPWTPAQTVTPAAFAKEISERSVSQRPLIVCVGFHTLYAGAHLPGSSFHGPASTPAGMADLKKWAQPLPRSANVVIYCGCCPLVYCPNIRPAFAALRDMGFTQLRLLEIPKDLATDWIQPGYPVARGK